MQKDAQDKKTELHTITQEIPNLQNELNSVEASMEKTNTELNSTRETQFSETEALRHSLADLERSLNTLRACEQQIQISKHQVEKTQNAQNIYQQAVDKYNSIVHDLEQQKSEVNRCRQNVVDQTKLFKDFELNISFKTVEREICEISEKIKHISQTVGGKNPLTEKAVMEEAAKKLQQLHIKEATIKGQRGEASAYAKQLETELKKSKFVNIDKSQRIAMIEAQTYTLAIKDLQKYHSALDKALMKYHSMKVEEINRLIKEMWQATYKGYDIDYIVLRSDTDEDATTATGRSYNYRVMMVKGDIELEMRGRCSTGQKVLAALIIRLALAESFCINCGILALDEPTTNLDRNNIEGLARALADLIESRKHHADFQLILITHDKEFVSTLARLQQCGEHFFQLTKNSKGSSTIHRADLSRIS